MRRVGQLMLALLLCLALCGCAVSGDAEKEADYAQAQTLFQEGAFAQAYEAFAALGDYKDSRYMLSEVQMARDYETAVALLEKKDYPGAYDALCALGDYKDTMELLERFQTIMLTEENWDTYYEICDELDWSNAEKAETGGYNGLMVHYIFRLKEEYCQKLYAPQKNTITAKLKGNNDVIEVFVLDETTGEYYFQEHTTGGASLEESAVQVQGVEQKVIIESQRVARSLNDDGRFDCYFCDQWSDWIITNFSGKLLIYQE